MQVTSVFVTHDQQEAMEVADRIVVMNHGRIEQDGSPEDVYDHPASPFVLQFLGDVNRMEGGAGDSAARAVGYVRPHELEIVETAEAGSLAVTLSQALTVGASTHVEFKGLDDARVVNVELPRAEYSVLRDRLALRPGSTVYLKPRRVLHFAGEAPRSPALV
jgi:sulfate transport system ATP-binding protein